MYGPYRLYDIVNGRITIFYRLTSVWPIQKNMFCTIKKEPANKKKKKENLLLLQTIKMFLKFVSNLKVLVVSQTVSCQHLVKIIRDPTMENRLIRILSYKKFPRVNLSDIGLTNFPENFQFIRFHSPFHEKWVIRSAISWIFMLISNGNQTRPPQDVDVLVLKILKNWHPRTSWPFSSKKSRNSWSSVVLWDGGDEDRPVLQIPEPD